MLAIVILNTQVMAADSNGNMVIVLDPGHGGGDPGASNSTYGLQEAKVNYQIAIYAKAIAVVIRATIKNARFPLCSPKRSTRII